MYGDDLESLRRTAQQIRDYIGSPDVQVDSDPIDEDEICKEGELVTRVHKTIERKAANKKKKIKSVLAKGQDLSCECCGFNFKKVYGDRGDGYIECHHTVPVSELKPGQSFKIADLSLVCANCHRMIHRQKPWLSIEEVRQILDSSAC